MVRENQVVCTHHLECEGLTLEVTYTLVYILAQGPDCCSLSDLFVNICHVYYRTQGIVIWNWSVRLFYLNSLY